MACCSCPRRGAAANRHTADVRACRDIAEDLRVELWGPFMTVSGTRASVQQHGGKGVVLRREMESGGFSATWKLPVRCAHAAHSTPSMLTATSLHTACTARHLNRAPAFSRGFFCTQQEGVVTAERRMCALQANGRLDSLYAESVDGVLRIYLRKRKAVEDLSSH